MSLADRLLKAGAKGNSASMLKKSKYFNEDIGIPTTVFSLNIALSGSIHGGILPGVGVIAGPSKHFKSNLSLEVVASYMREHTEAICIFYDSEFGTKKGYFAKSGVDEDRVIHVPVADIEELTFDVAQKLKEIGDDDKVIILIDSVGNLASKKEVDDAEKENSAMDMTRAKKLKGFFRIVTPKLHMKFIPMICIAHTYNTLENYSKTIISGGCVEGGTLITMEDGTLKPIELILSGEYVKTMTGSDKVTHTWDKNTLENGNPECYEIEFEDGTKVVCSDIHRFIRNGEWVEAQNLVTGDDVRQMIT